MFGAADDDDADDEGGGKSELEQSRCGLKQELEEPCVFISCDIPETGPIWTNELRSFGPPFHRCGVISRSL